MKMQIRRGVFETNSSSVHSITMCTGSDFDRWTDGELLFWEDEKKFGTREEIIENLKKSTWYDGKLRYPNIYTTPGGENVVAFGYYGHD